MKKNSHKSTHQSDFTEEVYRQIINMAKMKYKFIFYEEAKNDGAIVLWRHDLDLSVHRALRLAQIEAEQGVKATYFVHLHSSFYHWGEKETADIIRNIIEIGHQIGLHFDPSYYEGRISCMRDMSNWLKWEKRLLEAEFEQEIKAFSFHNPDIGGDWLKYDDNTIAGMINAYGRDIKERFEYCSDSNGYWRHQRLEDILLRAKTKNLHVLTHPGWWTPVEMKPRDRIQRCITGRANKCANSYDNFLERSGRENIK